MTLIIADTSGLYAIANKNDPYHKIAVKFLKSLAPIGDFAGCQLLVSNHVYDEIMTLTKSRLGMKAALQLGLRLRNSHFIKLMIFDEALEQATWRVFSRYHDKEWSYTDCCCFALAQEQSISMAFSFDHHFRQMGLQIVP